MSSVPRRPTPLSALLVLGWAMLEGPAHAANSREPSSPELPTVIVNTPRPPTNEELAGDSVPTFVAAHGSPAVLTGQLPRWHDGICPVTQGLSPGFNAFVSARILAVATAVGAPHKTDPCQHNVQILFAADPQKILDELAKRDPALLGFHYSSQAQSLTTFRHPIQGWYVTATRGDTGSEVMDNPMPVRQGSSPLSNASPAHWLESGTSPPGDAGSHLSTGLESVIVHVLILVDTKQVAGYPIGTISDYLAMMVLSQTPSPDDCGRLPSVLYLLAARCSEHEKPSATTAGDLAFLHALYAIDLRESLSLEGTDIRTNMMRQFKAH